MKTYNDVHALLLAYQDSRESSRRRLQDAERLYRQGRLTEVEYERAAAQFEAAARIVTILHWILRTPAQEGAA